MQYMDSTRSVAYHFDANAESCELLLHICFFIRLSQTWPIDSPTYCLFFARLITLAICGLHSQCICRTRRKVNGTFFSLLVFRLHSEVSLFSHSLKHRLNITFSVNPELSLQLRLFNRMNRTVSWVYVFYMLCYAVRYTISIFHTLPIVLHCLEGVGIHLVLISCGACFATDNDRRVGVCVCTRRKSFSFINKPKGVRWNTLQKKRECQKA